MDITAEIITSFRLAYPLLSNMTTWPDSIITIALTEGDAETGGSRWKGYVDEAGNLKQRGMFLFAAHWTVTGYPQGGDNSQSAATKNQMSAKSVGDESTTYNVPVVEFAGDSWLSSSQFGQQFMRLRKRVGMGSLAL